MAYYITTPNVFPQAIANTDTVQNVPIGTRVRAVDLTTYGEGEFIYLKGVASTVIGSVVIYDEYANTTTLGVAGSRGPVAVAMSANVALQYGWYQISGAAVVKAGTVVAGAATYFTATPGSLDDAVVATDKIDGMRFKTADGTPAATFAVVALDRPSASGNG
jgi:hypothetical protein